MPRLLFIDNIRWSMIVLVLSMHACDTYSPFGNWYYVDRQPTGLGTKIFFGAYQSFLQAFFMAVLFFIAGYFSAAAYDRKTFSQFVRDRVFRLDAVLPVANLGKWRFRAPMAAASPRRRVAVGNRTDVVLRSPSDVLHHLRFDPLRGMEGT